MHRYQKLEVRVRELNAEFNAKLAQVEAIANDANGTSLSRDRARGRLIKEFNARIDGDNELQAYAAQIVLEEIEAARLDRNKTADLLILDWERLRNGEFSDRTGIFFQLARQKYLLKSLPQPSKFSHLCSGYSFARLS